MDVFALKKLLVCFKNTGEIRTLRVLETEILVVAGGSRSVVVAVNMYFFFAAY